MIDYKNIDVKNLESELEQARTYLEKPWNGKQEDAKDNDTGFIYFCSSIASVLIMCVENNIVDETYAVKRWYNYHTSKMCEQLFINNGAVKEDNVKDKYVDIYINNIPYDVKLTIVPKKSNFPPLNSRNNKNKAISWLYNEQSLGGRNHNKNRIFIVCESDTYINSLLLKSNFELINESIEKYMEYIKSNEPNQIKLKDGNTVYADLILVSNK